MEKAKTESQIRDYENTEAPFVDYTHFDDCLANRTLAKEAFINGEKYEPEFNYPKMDSIEFDKAVIDKKQRIYEAVSELEAAKDYSQISDAELELYAASLEVRLKRIMLVEAAKNLYAPFNASSVETNERAFAKANEALYGRLDSGMYFGIINTEKDKFDCFTPANNAAKSIKDNLDSFYSKIETNEAVERKLLSSDELNHLRRYVFSRYGDILDVVPDTAEDRYYDVSECVKIMNDSLAAGGLDGWRAEENSSKTIVSTNGTKKRIFLPSSTKRNAVELKRLIMHEQEVHARRSDNGKKSGLKILKNGTANYVENEEGLAVMLECAVNGNFHNASFDRARNRYIVAGLALGADGCPRDGRGTFETMWRIIAVDKAKDGIIDEKNIKESKDAAYTLVENAYRGTQFWMQGMIYSKLKIYYEGLVANADFFKGNIDNLESAFSRALIGKYNHTSGDEYKLVEKILSTRGNENE